MNAGRFERDRLRIEEQSRGRSKEWRKRAMRHLVDDAGAEVVSTGSRVIAYRLPSGKQVCHKSKFKTEHQALETLRQIAEEPQNRKKPVRAYACYQCGGWHLTSRPK